jgi:hypothetical protein
VCNSSLRSFGCRCPTCAKGIRLAAVAQFLLMSETLAGIRTGCAPDEPLCGGSERMHPVKAAFPSTCRRRQRTGSKKRWWARTVIVHGGASHRFHPSQDIGIKITVLHDRAIAIREPAACALSGAKVQSCRCVLRPSAEKLTHTTLWLRKACSTTLAFTDCSACEKVPTV